jgi:hypothetical protein
MKKFVFLSVLAIFCFTVSYGQLVFDEASIDLVDEIVEEEGWDALLEYSTKQLLSFTDGDWFYLISYEPIDGKVKSRNAYLYKKKMVGFSDWDKADNKLLFEHPTTRTVTYSFDKDRVNTEKDGRSYLQKIKVKNKDLIVVFIKIEEKNGRARENFTDLYVFDPLGVYDDGSIQFDHIYYNLTQNSVFGIDESEDNRFYNPDRLMVVIDLNEQGKPMVQLVDKNGNRAGHIQYYD